MSSKYLRVYPPNPNVERGISTKLGSHGDRIIYANGKSIVIRDLSNPANDIVYSGHVQPTTVARISPTGFYAASADIAGNVRVWDTAGTEQVLKSEFKVLGGKINDLAWDGESKRIIAVGDGREKFGHVFQFDSGSSAGEVAGHAKAINAVSIRHQRPFRAATGGDDGQIVFHKGAPYKYDLTVKAHSNFIHSVNYAPSGSHFVSAGADAKVYLYDGTTAERAGEFMDAHSGSVFAATWSPDSTRIVTSSADCTVKLWDVETRKSTTTYTLGHGVDFHQLGNTWTSTDVIVSLSLDGVLNLFDPRDGSGPVRAIHAPKKSITSSTLVPSPPTFFTGASDGRIHSLALDDHAAQPVRVSGASHTTLVSSLSHGGGSVWSVGYDDKARDIDIDSNSFASSKLVQTASQPKGVAVSSQDSHVFIAEASHIEVLKFGQKVTHLDVSYTPLCVDVKGDVVVVGGEDNKVHVYKWANATLTNEGMLEGAHKGQVTSLAFSPDGTMLAAGDSSGKIIVFDVKERKSLIGRWTFHSARVYCLSWTSDSSHIASASLDTHIYIWSIAKPLKNIAIKNAIPGGAWGVQWIPGDDKKKGKLIGVGSDGAMRVWEVTFHV